MSKSVCHESLGYISVPALQQYIKSAEFYGLSHECILAESGIQPQQLVDNNGRLPGETLLNLLRYVLPRCGEPMFGLKTSQFIQPGSYHVLGYIIMTCSNIGEAISRISMYEVLVGDMGTTHVEHEPGAVVVRWNCRYQQPLFRRHVIENVLASWTSFARWISDMPDEAPLLVRFEHSAPEDGALLKQYQYLFRCPVLFDQPMSAVVLPSEKLDIPLRQPDMTLRESLEKYAQVSLQSLKTSYSTADRVRFLLRSMLADGSPSKGSVAERMGMSVRTLHGKLAEEGASYQQILDDLRYELAQCYLSNNLYSISEIAHKLGFTESRSFIRSFYARVGQSPGKFRQSKRGVEVGAD